MEEELEQSIEDEAPSRPSRRTLTFIVVPIIILFGIGTLGNAIHPTLIKEHPLWLVAMEPRNRWVILVADKVDFWPLLVISTIRKLVGDPLFYALGYLYKGNAVKWAERQFEELAPVVRGIERAFGKAGWLLVFLFPGIPVCVLAGATGMHPLVFGALNVAGTITMVTALYHFASLVEGPVNAINGFYGDNFKWLTVVSILITALYVGTQWRRGKTDIQSITRLEHELEDDEPPPAAS